MVAHAPSDAAVAPAASNRPRAARPAGGHGRLAAVLLASAVAVSLPRQAQAHEFRLAPSRYTAAPGDVVEVRAGVGEGLATEWHPFDSGRKVRFVARSARDIDLSPGAAAGDTVWVRLTPADRGGMMLAYQSDFAHITLEPEKFDAYLAEDGLDGPLATRRRSGASEPGRERYRRCAKAWLAGTERKRATQPIGLPLEIVPLEAPGRSPSLTVRLLFQGRPLPGALIRAWRRPLDVAAHDPIASPWSARTNARGEAVVPVNEPGEWLIGTVHMVPCADRDEADWESTWASLVFATGGDPRGGRGAAASAP